MNETEAIDRFLKLHQPDFGALYHPGMEVQVLVSPEGGTPVPDTLNTFTDGLNTWYNIRVPKNARTTPEYIPRPMTYALSQHALGIGMTGWQFSPERMSKHVGFDFDAIVGSTHLGTGYSQEELDRVRDAACALPWVEVRRSTGGGGLHLRVYFGNSIEKGIPTANHTEHAALGRAVLSQMSAEAGFNFADKVDICGGNMWVWHRKATKENEGFALLKPCEHNLIVPANWRDHIEVVSHKRRKVRVAGLADAQQDEFEKISTANKIIQMTPVHLELLDWLNENGWTAIWEADHCMLRTHTYALLEAHKALSMRGIFKTLASGSGGKGDYNCFCFPRDDGGWRVVRYGSGTMEANTWQNGEGGWTYCYLNQKPDLNTAAIACGGNEDQAGGYVFKNWRDAVDVAELLGAKLVIPEGLQDRDIRLKAHKDGERLVIEMEKKAGDSDTDLAAFVTKKRSISQVLNAQVKANVAETTNYDVLVRHLLSPAATGAGWVINIRGQWINEPKDNVVTLLMSTGMDGNEARSLTGVAISDGWQLVNLPFQPEYPGSRQWNKDAAQLRFVPSDDEDTRHPHWDKILSHCGRGLDLAVKMDEWCRKNGVFVGGDYLKLWVASLIQRPDLPLPYLFFYSDPYQNCGKSSFHQAISLLMTRGVMRIENALTSNGNFSGELAGVVLGVVEETDLSKAGSRAYDRIKDWTTSRQISVHQKNLTPYMQKNTLHIIQCANSQRYCPVFDGDTRITLTQVPPLIANTEIPWPRLEQQLCDEAPAFLRTILDIVLPDSGCRLNLPVIETEEKGRSLELTRTELQQFLHDRCVYAPGVKLGFSEFFEAFSETLGISERAKWTKSKIAMELPPKFPRGIGAKGKTFIGNISLENIEVPSDSPAYVRVGNKLVLENGEETDG